MPAPAAETQAPLTSDYRAMPASPAAPKKAGFAPAPYVAEFIGTFIVVFTMACSEQLIVSVEWQWTAVGLSLMAMVYSTAPISGGNLNPAVSLTFGFLGVLDWMTVMAYWIVQLLGGIIAGWVARFLFDPYIAGYGATPPYHWHQALVIELIYTTMLCFVFCNCIASKRNNSKEDANQYYGLAIGLVMIAAGYASGEISRGRLNPAASIGLVPLRGLGEGLLWSIFELLGACLAALLFCAIRAEETRLSDRDLAVYKHFLSTRCLSEFLGAFLLTLTFGLNLVLKSPAVAWSTAAASITLLYALGSVSGHFNPAITAAVLLSDRNKCSNMDGLSYIGAQLLGGAFAGLIYSGYHSAGPYSDLSLGYEPGLGHTLSQACTVEFIFTFLLCYVLLATQTIATPSTWRTRQNFYSALAIGSCLAVAGISTGNISNTALNPAVCLGIDIARSIHPGPLAVSHLNLFIVALWQLCGGIVAVAIFWVTHPQEFVAPVEEGGLGRSVLGGA